MSEMTRDEVLELLRPLPVPEQRIGQHEILKFSVSKAQARDFNRSQNPLFGGDGRYIQAGSYMKLVRHNPDDINKRPVIVMSDTPAERKDHVEPVIHGQGHCLVLGLGIGMVTRALLEKPEVERVTVVERSDEVLDLVASTYLEKYGDRLEIVQADALEWKPQSGTRFGVVWCDIWDTIDPDNWPEYVKLTRRYQNRSDWRGCWAKARCWREVGYVRGYAESPCYLPAFFMW